MVYASIGKRIAAALIDVIVLAVAVFLIRLVLIGVLPPGSRLGHLPWIPLEMMYYAGMESSAKMGTLGKQAMGIVVVSESGHRLTLVNALGRYLGKFLSYMTLGIGFLMAAFTDRSQCLHDRLARTVVLEVR